MPVGAAPGSGEEARAGRCGGGAAGGEEAKRRRRRAQAGFGPLAGRYLPPRAERYEKHAGGLWATGVSGCFANFLCYFFPEQSFDVFCSVLSKFSYSFFIQIIPTKICLENIKVTVISVKY